MNRCTLISVLMATALASVGPSFSDLQARKNLQFGEAELFFELNDTDGDLGLHANLDAETWTSLEIEGPRAVGQLLSVVTRGALRQHGMTQLNFESAEPSFDELSPEEVLERFPEGRYTIEARAQEGGDITGSVHLSHVLAAPPANVLISSVPAAASCDEPPPLVIAPVTIRWDPVTGSHPDIGKKGPVTVAQYQVIVEREGVAWQVELPPTVTEVEVPAGITSLGSDFKFEIIVRTATGNNTAIESCFQVQ